MKLHDGLGSVRGVFDGTLQSAAEYDPFGEPIVAPSGTAYGFTGELTDGNGLVYLRARYLAPALGTFASRDPWRGSASAPRTWNGYAWVEGNVVNRVDPGGMAAGIAACESSAPVVTSNLGLLGSIAGSGGSNGLVSIPVDAPTAMYTVGLGAGFSGRGGFEFSDVDEATRKKWEEDCLKHYNNLRDAIKTLQEHYERQRENALGMWEIRDLPEPFRRIVLNGKDKGSWDGHIDELHDIRNTVRKVLGRWKGTKTSKDDNCPDPDGLESTANAWLDMDFRLIVPKSVTPDEDLEQKPPDPIPFQQVPVDPLYIPCDATCQLARWLLLFGAAGGLAGGAILRAQ